MPRPEKEAAVKELKTKFEGAKAAVVTDYRGLDVHAITELRRKLREAGVEYKVVKNTLTRLAAKEVEIQALEKYLAGPTAIAFGFGDPVAPARIISEFAKDHKELEIKGGILRGRIIGVSEVQTLAFLPSRDVLIAQVLATLQGPISGLVSVLHGTMRNLVYVLEAIRKQKEPQGQAV